ncbi:sensor histidine kinase [Methylobacterium sp. JK268]
MRGLGDGRFRWWSRRALAEECRRLGRRLRASEEAVAGLVDEREAALQRLALARSEERMRVSRDLHDEAGQSLAILKLVLQGLRPHLAAAASHRLDTAIGLTDRLARELQRVAGGLAPSALDRGEIGHALRALAADWAATSGIPVEVTTRGDDSRLAAPVQAALYRIAQESLTNIAKHALTASQVSVRLHCKIGRAALIVVDDGPGLPSDEVGTGTGQRQSEAQGIIGMGDRVAQLGGRLAIYSKSGRGTCVRAWVPVKEDL